MSTFTTYTTETINDVTRSKEGKDSTYALCKEVLTIIQSECKQGDLIQMSTVVKHVQELHKERFNEKIDFGKPYRYLRNITENSKIVKRVKNENDVVFFEVK